MSDSEPAAEISNVVVIRTRAAEWLTRQHDAGAWSETDQAALDTWLAQSTAHEVAYIRLEAAWTKANRLAALRHRTSATKPVSQAKSRPLARITALATVALLAGLMGAYVLPTSSEDTLTVQTGVGGHKVISLTDGSRIELNTDTSVRIAVNSATRSVWLERGEAYFDVRHDSARPFIVTAQGRRITDLGTKFSVHDEIDRLEVSLLQGSARIEPVNAAEPTHVLKPGDVAIVTRLSLIITHKPDKQLINDLAWRKGLLIFKYATLGVVVDEFNRYNQHKIVLSDPSLAHLSVVGTFRANDPNGFIELAREVFNVHAQQRGEAVVLSR